MTVAMRDGAITQPRVLSAQVNIADMPRVIAAADPAAAGMQAILQIERDARRVKTVQALQFLIANETRRLVGARQVFVLGGIGERISAVSSLSGVERQSPVIQWLEEQVRSLSKIGIASSATPNVAAGPMQVVLEPTDGIGEVFPFRHALLSALAAPAGSRFGYVLAVRETVFTEAEAHVLQRICETFAHAWGALAGPPRPLLGARRKIGMAAGCLAGLVALGLLPVPMTALAPVEVAPRASVVVAAVMDGAIEQVVVDPNQAVQTGDVLFRYLDAQAKGALEIAAREVAVAEARLRQVTQMAFVDASAKRDLAVARTELRLKRAERDFAAELFVRTVVRASADGVAVFADKRELIGRPVTTGQRIMDIADPARTQFRLQVPADDALVLNAANRIRVFMDADPLNPLQARLLRAAPMAKASESGALSFKAEAELADGGQMPPLGHRGTAQISGETVTLAFYLLRRPLASLRQRTGW